MITLVILGLLAAAWWVAHESWSAGGANLIAIVVGAYLLWCTYDPRIDCWGCRGKGKRRSGMNEKVFHNCLVCKGRGQRARFGALLWARNRHLYDRSSGGSPPAPRVGNVDRL